MKKKLDQYLKFMLQKKASDVHIKALSGIRIRVDGVLTNFGEEKFSKTQMERLVEEITNSAQLEALQRDKSLDFSYKLDDDESRFRVNIFYQIDGLSAVFRAIPEDIPKIQDLNLPTSIEGFSKIQRGLVLVTGVTGSGKSTTLASLIDVINKNQKKHIITIEDPIEFVHKDKNSFINQRAIGIDAHSFKDALRASLREDPDVILVGEMRDLETIEIAINAANTGHLVFSTLHTLSAKDTIDRIIGMFPNDEQNRVRLSLAAVLEGVISQRLLPTMRGGGRIPAVEVMKKSARIADLISSGRDNEILDAIEEGRKIYGMQSFDQSIYDLFLEGRITEATALDHATSRSDMKLNISKISDRVSSGDDIVDFKEEEEA
ncbi:MAG: PilT/PilU family type 4a pilus ATPase [Campylobacterales bacterium]|nr:PilT/PilU family type 4a pilus ATPase [Campylobacterales bacterium]